MPRGRRGLNRPHLKVLLGELGQATWQPDMARLEGLRSTAEMSQQDYAQSWAWAHFLLESTDERHELLVDYLHTLRAQGSAPPPRPRPHFIFHCLSFTSLLYFFL